jgi:hypothetical protein
MFDDGLLEKMLPRAARYSPYILDIRYIAPLSYVLLNIFIRRYIYGLNQQSHIVFLRLVANNVGHQVLGYF